MINVTACISMSTNADMRLNEADERSGNQAVDCRDPQAGRKADEGEYSKYFSGLIDNDMYHVKNELDKLIGFVGDRDEITKEDVDEIACVQVNGQIFQMMDAVASGDQKRAMKLYRDLLELRESAMSILYLLSRHFNILLQINDLGSGVPKGEIAR